MLPPMSKLVICPVVSVTSVHIIDRHLEALRLRSVLYCKVELMLPMVASDTWCR